MYMYLYIYMIFFSLYADMMKTSWYTVCPLLNRPKLLLLLLFASNGGSRGLVGCMIVARMVFFVVGTKKNNSKVKCDFNLAKGQ